MKSAGQCFPIRFGIPNVDDFITINGQFVQSGTFIPLAVSAATGTQITNPACVVGVSVALCAFPRPHHHPVDVSGVIPVGKSTVTVEICDAMRKNPPGLLPLQVVLRSMDPLVDWPGKRGLLGFGSHPLRFPPFVSRCWRSSTANPSPSAVSSLLPKKAKPVRERFCPTTNLRSGCCPFGLGPGPI